MSELYYSESNTVDNIICGGYGPDITDDIAAYSCFVRDMGYDMNQSYDYITSRLGK